MIEQKSPKLHKTFWFWCALITPISIALDLGLVMAYFTPETHGLFSYSTINLLIIELKLPIAIAGLSIPLVAMVAAVHRSSQTAEQIRVQHEQNTFSNHFKHLEEFNSRFHDKDFIYSTWGSVEALHRYIYPDSQNGNIEPKEYTFDHRAVLTEIKTVTEAPDIDIKKRIKELHLELANYLEIQPPKGDSYSFSDVFSFINSAHSFSAHFPPPIKTEDIQEFSTAIENAREKVRARDIVKAQFYIACDVLKKTSSLDQLKKDWERRLGIPSKLFSHSLYWMLYQTGNDEKLYDILDSIRLSLFEELRDYLLIDKEQFEQMKAQKEDEDTKGF
jgi:hypothetical protein